MLKRLRTWWRRMTTDELDPQTQQRIEELVDWAVAHGQTDALREEIARLQHPSLRDASLR